MQNEVEAEEHQEAAAAGGEVSVVHGEVDAVDSADEVVTEGEGVGAGVDSEAGEAAIEADGAVDEGVEDEVAEDGDREVVEDSEGHNSAHIPVCKWYIFNHSFLASQVANVKSSRRP
jgi:hypothetical protein